MNILGYLMAVGCLSIIVLASVSFWNNRDAHHIPRYEDEHPESMEPVWLVEEICRWGDRNMPLIGRVLFFLLCLLILKGCTL